MASVYDEAAQALKSSRLYVAPQAATELDEAGIPFSDSEQEAARRTLASASTPIYLAVLPASAEQDPGGLERMARAVGSDGTYVVLLPDLQTTAGSTILESGAAQKAAVAVSSQSLGVPQFVDGLVERIETLAAGDGSNDGVGESSGGGWLPLVILAAAGGGGFLLYRRNKLSKERAQLEQVRGALDEDITAYGEQLSALDLDVQTTSEVPIEARHEYSRALDLYEQAKTFADRAEKPGDLKPVTHALEEGRWLLGCVDARLKGEPLPDRRLPCFFDPRHGPSAEDIEWAPPGGVPRVVPACAADALRIKNGSDPNVRMVPAADGEQRPYWDAGPAYGGWAGGYFGGFLPGMLMGTMLGSAMADPIYIDGAADGGGDFGGGFDGGDFGGGFDGGGFDGGGF